ncbi:hypothetical protein [Sphingomonas sp. R1]|uniref:hypothetical protein n=1 Tax=Sphingomonas sp. R1 TaxID=399176 RepID=UPI002224A6D6|nr:hypothetical protein [Sphingomonas sp. R1]UYY76809.1 hypothetical protein OIM94_15050 [Sphingomonas sp. R1]
MACSKEQLYFEIIFGREPWLAELVLPALRTALESSFKARWSPAPNAGLVTEDVLTMRVWLSPSNLGADVHVPTCCSSLNRVAAHCDLMDQLEVPNGTKAISIALHNHWGPDYRRRFGDPASPSTVKRWRASRKAGKSTPGEKKPRQLTDADRVVRNLRRYHALRVAGGGGTIREGYRRVLRDIETSAASHRSSRERGDRALPLSYETFRRDCQRIRAAGRGRDTRSNGD